MDAQAWEWTGKGSSLLKLPIVVEDAWIETWLHFTFRTFYAHS